MSDTIKSTTVKEMEVDFIYTFNPTTIKEIVLAGDAAFKERVGEIVLMHGTLEPLQEWILGDDGFFAITIPVDRMIDTVRLSLAAGEAAHYDRIRFLLDDAETLLTERQRVFVEARTFWESAVLTGGMSGSLKYRSEQSRKICRIDIVCDSNARARLRSEGFEWQEEDLGDVAYWRGINIVQEPEFITEYTFQFGGKDSQDNIIGDGLLHSVHFYEEVQETEYDSPILVRFAIDVHRNNQEGIFYYIDDNGREHCVAVNEMQFTNAEWEHLHHDPATQTTLKLTTEYGMISGIVAGAVNLECLDNSLTTE